MTGSVQQAALESLSHQFELISLNQLEQEFFCTEALIKKTKRKRAEHFYLVANPPFKSPSRRAERRRAAPSGGYPGMNANELGSPR